jgi:hypothetical protein
LLEKLDAAGVDYVGVVLNMKTAKALGLVAAWALRPRRRGDRMTRRAFISLLGARLMPSSKLWRVRVQPMAPGDKAAGEQALAEVTPFWQ